MAMDRHNQLSLRLGAVFCAMRCAISQSLKVMNANMMRNNPLVL
jgi:hypothetical protein